MSNSLEHKKCLLAEKLFALIVIFFIIIIIFLIICLNEFLNVFSKQPRFQLNIQNQFENLE